MNCVMLKGCSKCKYIKHIKLFGLDKSTKDGYKTQCKDCRKEYRERNRILIKAAKQRYNSNNKEKIRRSKQAYNKKYKQKIAEYNKKYRKNNRTIVVEKERLRLEIDINFKLRKNLRRRIAGIVSEFKYHKTKSGSAIFDLGCSIDELKIYLANKFYCCPKTGEAMTWGNYGFYGWHIDHIIPLDSFDLTDRKQFLKACHYTNIQPLWAEENLSKSNKIIV